MQGRRSEQIEDSYTIAGIMYLVMALVMVILALMQII